MSLQNAQADFIDALFSTNTYSELVTPVSHLAIYRNNILSSLLGTLKNTYPLVLALLGEDFFNMTAREYIRQYPSRSGNLHDFGEYFADFLADYQPVHDLIYLTEVAEFEWATHVIYLAPNHPPFAAQTLATFTPEQHERLQFLLHPACWLKKFHYPILQIIDLCKANRQDTIDIHSGGVNLLMIRRELDVALISLDAADFAFLQTLNSNGTLGEALQAAQLIYAEYPLEEKLPYFIDNKILVDCYLS
jgi:hypothetical protein